MYWQNCQSRTLRIGNVCHTGAGARHDAPLIFRQMHLQDGCCVNINTGKLMRQVPRTRGPRLTCPNSASEAHQLLESQVNPTGNFARARIPSMGYYE